MHARMISKRMVSAYAYMRVCVHAAVRDVKIPPFFRVIKVPRTRAATLCGIVYVSRVIKTPLYVEFSLVLIDEVLFLLSFNSLCSREGE